jgi:hypothetical protein
VEIQEQAWKLRAEKFTTLSRPTGIPSDPLTLSAFQLKPRTSENLLINSRFDGNWCKRSILILIYCIENVLFRREFAAVNYQAALHPGNASSAE